MMDFYHPLMQKWIPSTIFITEQEYLVHQYRLKGLGV